MPVLIAAALAAASLVLGTTPTPAATSTPSTSGQPSLVVTVRDPRVSESSGLAASPTRPDLVWTVNDSGGSATVLGISLRTGRVAAVLRLADTQARDWEAMSAGVGADGTGLLWIGDVGDNRGVRESVVLRLVPEPRRLGATTSAPVSLRVRYPGGPVDVETLIWTPERRLLLVSKGLLGAVVYEVPQPAVTAALTGRSTSTPVLATRVATVSQSLVTDGVALPDGRIVLRGYQSAAVYAGLSDGGRLARLQSVPLPAQEQGETVAVLDRGAALLVGSEGAGQPLWRVPIAVAAEPTSTPTQLPTVTPTQTAASSSTTPPTSPPEPQPTPPPRALLVVFFIGGIASLATILTRYQRQRRRRRR
jgi:hypothetical protein